MIEIKGVTIDKKWKWMAKDETGAMYMYEDIPKMRKQDWYYQDGAAFLTIHIVGLSNIPWDQSLHEIRHTDDGLILMPWRPSFIVDDPVMVRNCEKCSWVRRHFAGWTDKGRIQAWDRGGTSFSSTENAKTWAYYRLPTPEELNRNANHK